MAGDKVRLASIGLGWRGGMLVDSDGSGDRVLVAIAAVTVSVQE